MVEPVMLTVKGFPALLIKGDVPRMASDFVRLSERQLRRNQLQTAAVHEIRLSVSPRQLRSKAIYSCVYNFVNRLRVLANSCSFEITADLLFDSGNK
jgi:EAL domain-containing protein (putative c-di-GMP-specific phosphodiesterase class I)